MFYNDRGEKKEKGFCGSASHENDNYGRENDFREAERQKINGSSILVVNAL